MFVSVNDGHFIFSSCPKLKNFLTKSTFFYLSGFPSEGFRPPDSARPKGLVSRLLLVSHAAQATRSPIALSACTFARRIERLAE
jgi:hypothetical protein